MADYLRRRGHSLWLDKVKIEEFTDWRLEITKGILECDVALICLTPNAMKLGGVCRDEINIAVGVRGGNIQPILFEPMELGEYPSHLTTKQIFTDLQNWREHWKKHTDPKKGCLYEVEWFESIFKNWHNV